MRKGLAMSDRIFEFISFLVFAAFAFMFIALFVRIGILFMNPPSDKKTDKDAD